MMKKILELVANIFIIIFFSIATGLFIFRIIENISLIVNSQEINAKIQEVEFHNSRRSHYCTIYFEYEYEGITYTSDVQFNYLIIDRIKNSITNEYRKNSEILIAFDKYGNYQVKKQIKKELFIYSVYFLMSILFLYFLIYSLFLIDPKKSKEAFYIQDTKFKVKKIKKVENIINYINMLKRNEIICFGIGNDESFVEYSYTGKDFIERKSNKKEESENIISDEKTIEKKMKYKLNKLKE